MTTSGKRLYRSRNDRMVAGVCGGIGQYLNIDTTLVRLAVLFLALWGGGGVLAYLIAWVVIPEEPFEEMDMGGQMQPQSPPATTNEMPGESTPTE